MRINLLGGISYSPLFDKEDERAAAAKQRESIQVQTTGTDDSKEEKEEKVEAKEEEQDGQTSEDDIEDNKEEIEAKDDEVEDLEQEKKEAKSEKDKERIQRRIDRLTKEKSDLKKENARLQALLDAKPDSEKALTEEEVERRAEAKAEEKRLKKQFEDDCDKLATEAKKLDKKFDDKVQLMAEEIGNIPSQMIGILADLPNGGAVLSHLTNNLDDAEEIYKLSPARMALKLSKLSDELVAKSKKQISKVPPARDKSNGTGNTPDVLRDDMPMDDWVKLRNKQASDHRKVKLGLH